MFSSHSRCELLGQADGADRDPPVADAQAVVGVGFVERGQQVVEIRQRLAHAHHDDVAQPLVGRQQPLQAAASARRSRRVVRLRSTPSRPLAQNTQPIAQPTCVLMQIVRRSSSRSSTHSIPVEPSRVGQQFQQQLLRAVGRLQMLRDLARPERETPPPDRPAAAFGRSLIASKLSARPSKTHLRICAARNALLAALGEPRL